MSQYTIIVDHSVLLQAHQVTPLGKFCCQATVSGGKLCIVTPNSGFRGPGQTSGHLRTTDGQEPVHPNYSYLQGFLLCYFDPIPQTQILRVQVSRKIAGINDPKIMEGKVRTKIKPFQPGSHIYCHNQLYLVSPFTVSLCIQYYHTFKSQPSTVVSLVFHSFVILFVPESLIFS